MGRFSANCSVIDVEPSVFTEFIESIPSMVENCRSSGVATAEDMVSGFAPARLALTTSVGISMLGRSLTGNARYATTPNSTIAAITSVVATARRMKISVKPCDCGVKGSRFIPRTRNQKKASSKTPEWKCKPQREVDRCQRGKPATKDGNREHGGACHRDLNR